MTKQKRTSAKIHLSAEELKIKTNLKRRFIIMKNNVKYLVTGAAGFLGGTVCRQLIERGESVRAFVLPGDPAEKYVPEEAEIVEGDLTDMASLEKLFEVEPGTETVVLHIASIVSVDPGFSSKVMEVNVDGTRNIIRLCLSHPECKKLVYCSSTGAIPEAAQGQAIREVGFFAPRSSGMLQPFESDGEPGSSGCSS